MVFHFVLSSAFFASFAFVKQMHRAIPIPYYKFSDKNIAHFLLRFFL